MYNRIFPFHIDASKEEWVNSLNRKLCHHSNTSIDFGVNALFLGSLQIITIELLGNIAINSATYQQPLPNFNFINYKKPDRQTGITVKNR